MIRGCAIDTLVSDRVLMPSGDEAMRQALEMRERSSLELASVL